MAGWWHHDPLYPPFNVYGDAYLSTTAAFFRKLWSKIYETFSSGNTHTYTHKHSRSSFSIAVAHLVCRAWLIPTVAQSSASSEELLGLAGYRDIQHIPELRLWQTSGTHPRRILENPCARLLHATYIQAGITDDRCRHNADLGLGISRYNRPRASLARFSRAPPRDVRAFFTSIYIDKSIGASFLKNISRRRFYVTGKAGIKF